jgi:hypothetical protein
VFAHKVLRELFSDFDDTGIIHDVFNFHAVELTEKDLEQLTALNELDYDCHNYREASAE